jgi:cysteinyl-tRNA synthetase
MAIRVYNTLTRRIEDFQPVTPGRVGIYLCGVTVYKPSHIGHTVGPIIFDAIKRYLTYRGFAVTWIVNITDVDDKLIDEAARQGRPMLDIAREIEASYKDGLARLGVTRIDAFPRATEFIGEIIALVQRLADRNAAYAADASGAVEGAKDVYFDHTADSDYGKLSGRRIEDQLAGTRTLAGENRRHPADFALWKAAKPGEPAWDSPWGKGRPGWHIECSVMSMKMLGETFDIHGGGMDLIFPHHENEIAQSETATGKPFAKYWLHNGLTRVKTKAAGGEVKSEKMSKSLGNIRTISSLLEEYPAETIRAFILSTHYRRPLDFSDEQLQAAGRALESFYRLFERVQRITGEDVYIQRAGSVSDGANQSAKASTIEVDVLAQILNDAGGGTTPVLVVAQFALSVVKRRVRFFDEMDNDFNTAGAIASLFEIEGDMNNFAAEANLESSPSQEAKDAFAAAGRTIVELGRILGLFEQKPKAQAAPEGLSDADIQKLIEQRKDARKAKDFALADEIRKDLATKGITLEDLPGGTIFRRG